MLIFQIRCIAQLTALLLKTNWKINSPASLKSIGKLQCSAVKFDSIEIVIAFVSIIYVPSSGVCQYDEVFFAYFSPSHSNALYIQSDNVDNINSNRATESHYSKFESNLLKLCHHQIYQDIIADTYRILMFSPFDWFGLDWFDISMLVCLLIVHLLSSQ